MDPAQEGEQIAQFCAITGATADLARRFLSDSDWNPEEAVEAFYENGEGGDEDEVAVPPLASVPALGTTVSTSTPIFGNGRTLGTAGSSSAARPSSSAPSPAPKSSQKYKPKKKITGLSDLQDEHAGHGHDDDSDKDQEYFAGGDKSALAVTEPGSGHNQHVQRLLETARRNGPPPPREDGGGSSRFSGAGQTLGGDDAPSQIIPDPHARAPRALPMVERTLHLWDDGFSIDDGLLFRYDDPRNAQTLDMINRGSAPLDIMGVEAGQAVDVKLEAHRGENYVQPKMKYKPFSGGGQRLGSPVPGPASTPNASSQSATSTTPTISAPTGSTSTVDVNELEPVITLQIRLADGTRLPSRFNTSHTVGDVYAFVTRAHPAQREFSLATTFPTKELTDKDQVLGSMAEFKRGGVVVQRWV